MTASSSPELPHNKSGFCQDMDHLCHEDQQRLEDLYQYVLDGLITAETADIIYRDQISYPHQHEEAQS